MTTTHSRSVQEHLPTIDSFVDDEGDVRHIDDDTSGFPAVGHTPKGADHFRSDAVVPSEYEGDTPVALGVAVDLGMRAVKLREAVDKFSRASMLRGFIESNNLAKIVEYGGKDVLKSKVYRNFKLGDAALRAAYGIDAMLENPAEFPDEYDGPYDDVKADYEMIEVRRNFLDTYTGYGVRSMKSDATVADKKQKRDSINAARDNLRKTLERQRP